MLKRLYLFLIVTVLAVGTAMAQDAIRWRTTAKMTSDTEGVLTVRALVADGWHLYGTKLPKGGPKPTVLDFSKSVGVKFIGDFKPSVAPVTKQDATFGMALSFWGQNVTFTRRFKLTGAKEKAQINGSITFMGCNDETCLPPKTLPVTGLRIR